MTYKVSLDVQLSLKYSFSQWIQFPAIQRTCFWPSFLVILDPKTLLKHSHSAFFTSSFFFLCDSPVSSKLNCSTPTHLSRSYSNDNSEVLHNTSSSSHSSSETPQHFMLLGICHIVFCLLLSLSLSLIQLLWIWKLVYHFAFGSQFTWHL